MTWWSPDTYQPAGLRRGTATSTSTPDGTTSEFIIPAIFPAYVTGGITAAGGAWNASIVAEIVTYGSRTLVATGLGAYIAEATTKGEFPKILIGIVVMSTYVVGLNRLVWRRLYRLAETRYSL